MDYEYIEDKVNTYKSKISMIFIIVCIIIILLLMKQCFTLSSFLIRYKYHFDYGNMLRDVCNGAYTEYETARFQILDNIEKIKIKTGMTHHLIALVAGVTLCVFFMSLVWGYYIFIVSGGKAPFQLMKDMKDMLLSKNKNEYIGENHLDIFQYISILLSLYFPLIVIVYLILKLSRKQDISPFQQFDNKGNSNIIHTPLIIPGVLLIIVIYYYTKHSYVSKKSDWDYWKILTFFSLFVMFSLSAWIMTLICDVFERKNTNSFYKNVEEFEKDDRQDEKDVDIMSKLIIDSFGFASMRNMANPGKFATKFTYAYHKIYNDITSIVLIICIIFIGLYGLYVLIAYFFKNNSPVKPDNSPVKPDNISNSILYLCFLPFMILYLILVLLNINYDYNTYINKYILYKPYTLYRQIIEKINRIFNQMLENDKTNISNKSVCKNIANAIHLAIYQDIFRHKTPQKKSDGSYPEKDNSNDDMTKYNGIIKKVNMSGHKDNPSNAGISTISNLTPLLFVPRFTYESVCDPDEYIEYNTLEEYNIDAYINADKNIFFNSKTSQCSSIKNILIIVIMNNFIPDNDKVAYNLFDKEIKKQKITTAIKNIINGRTFDNEKDLKMSDDYESNNSLNNKLLETAVTLDGDKYKSLRDEIIPKIVDIYDQYLNTMLLETRKTVKSICKCADTEDITTTSEYKTSMPNTIMENNSAYQTTMKKNYVNTFVQNTKDMFTNINNILSSTISSDAKSKKLASFVITNYNMIYQDEHVYQLRTIKNKTINTSAENPLENAYMHIEDLETDDSLRKDVGRLNTYLTAFQNEYKNMYYKDNNYYNKLLYDYKEEFIKNLITADGNDTKIKTAKTLYESKYAKLAAFSKKIQGSGNIQKGDTMNDSKESSENISKMAHKTSKTVWIMFAMYIIVFVIIIILMNLSIGDSTNNVSKTKSNKASPATEETAETDSTNNASMYGNFNSSLHSSTLHSSIESDSDKSDFFNVRHAPMHSNDQLVVEDSSSDESTMTRGTDSRHTQSSNSIQPSLLGLSISSRPQSPSSRGSYSSASAGSVFSQNLQSVVPGDPNSE